MAIDVDRLRMTSASDVVADPARWTHLLAQVPKSAGAMGAGLLPHARSAGALASPSLKDCLQAYLAEGWLESDRYSRKRAIELQRRGEVAVDRDLVAHRGQRSPFLDDFLPRFDGKWWAGLGFRSGFWSLTLHRSPREGLFHEHERAILRQFSARLSEIATLSYLTGRATLSAVTGALDQICKAAVAIDETGRVIRANAAAERVFGDDMRIAGGRLLLGDRGAAAEYATMLDRLRGASEGKTLRAAPIVVRREPAPMLIKALPVDGAARSPFLHARALLLLDEIGPPARPDWQPLGRAFGLTPAEARLAARLATGESLDGAAKALRITRETARSRLKSVFQKTGVHRQGELVALLASLPRSG